MTVVAESSAKIYALVLFDRALKGVNTVAL